MERRPTSFFYRRKQAADGVDAPQRRRRRPGLIARIVRRACFGVGALVLFSIAMGLFVSFLFGRGGPESLPDDMILVLNITDPIGESEHARSLSDPFAAAGITVGDLIETLDKAKDDARVRGLLVSLDNAGMELAHIQELRAAVKRFRASGKFANIYTASFADLGSGIGAYYFASAFDKIWMQPVGMVSMTGLSLEMPFAKDVLDKVGAKADFLHREEYKSAMESFTNAHMSDANRVSMQSILDDFSGQVFNDIAFDRNLTRPALQTQLDKGLITGGDALKAGLIDELDYADVLLQKLRDETTGNKDSDDPPVVDIADYYATMEEEKSPGRKDNVGLVRIAGEIVPGDEPEPGYATGDYIANAVMDAADDKNIKVIVVRVDSPGGSPSASETIRRSIVYAKEKGKKIVVSMGPVAASGGYWVTVDADKIYAMPTTLTGSIGVIMGKFEISGLWKKVGVNWESLTWGRNAKLWSMNSAMSETERASLNIAIDDTYMSFIKRVAEGRHMKPEQVREIAKGRAWTGTQAKANGLVDDLGGLDNALDYAATLIGEKDRSALRVREIPKPLSPLEQLLRMMGSQVGIGDYPGKGGAMLKVVEPFLRKADVMERSGPVQAYDASLPIIRP
ncbi:MAG: signal peptide peptidase SppA [Micavibrio aeruginosavorus]|uniref:Signal peptide peptidase SppA n=1 Tax=Micavibrio aeruginosavorus TaxID=349221 RepID=A0A2W5MW14_9BACT|nr:MAG: signal peptide peptidase SppA [Micavibrio aeruginosavorus]